MTTFESSRFVIIDDTDPRIQYEGSDWKLTTAGTTEAWGIFGPTYNHTLQQTSKDASLSFRFNGTHIGLYGTIDTLNNQPRPSWLCTIDGKGSGRVTADPDQHTNHWVFCETDVAGLQEHIVTLNVTVPDGATFWFDQISYAPPEDVVQGETLMIQDTDSMITYQPGTNWNERDGITYDTDVPGSTLTFNFTGTAATFYSVLQPNLNGSTAAYSLDGGPSTTFPIPSHNDANRLFNQPLFSASGLTPADHSLVVTYTGQKNNTPLSLDYFYVTLPPRQETTTPSGSVSPPSPSNTGNSKPKSSAGAIAGGVVGGVVGLAILGLIIFVLMRRHRRREDPSNESNVTPFSAQTTQNEFTQGLVASRGSVRPASSDTDSAFDPYSSPSTTTDPNSAVRKQQEAMASFNTQPRDVHHTDSGVRLGEPSGSGVVRDIPPQYTET